MKRLMKLSARSFGLMVLALTLASSAAHAERDAMVRGVGAGIAYAAPDQALIENPAVLAEAGKTSLAGMWRFEMNKPWVSLSGAYGPLGLGADWRQDASGENIYQAGFGAMVSFVSFGFTVRNVSGTSGGLDADAAVNLDFNVLRLSAVLRGLEAGPDRLDIGLGIKAGPAFFAIDVKKPWPLDQGDATLIDISVSAAVQKLSFGLGYNFIYDKALSRTVGGDLHAGISFEIMQKFFIEGNYRPLAQEWPTSRWTLGARYQFN